MVYGLLRFARNDEGGGGLWIAFSFTMMKGISVFMSCFTSFVITKIGVNGVYGLLFACKNKGASGVCGLLFVRNNSTPTSSLREFVELVAISG